ncbi:helix-turn-helix domain-containing protein [Streptacidiphilus sp. N1-12]|uniref:Helix-turn-helix domain-containing protein n=2 Tax=Streptacidiphilus alkalitolerans TaxID=3342712 RepID=A0ABV6WEB7_9ACTN
MPKDPIGPFAEQELLRVGRIVASVREWRDLGQEHLAEQAGITARQVQRIEAGDGDPAISYYARLAQGLRVPLSWLFADDWRSLAGLDPHTHEGGEPAATAP